MFPEESVLKFGVWCPSKLQHCRLLPAGCGCPQHISCLQCATLSAPNLHCAPHTFGHGDSPWESRINPHLSPSSSTSSIISCSSSGVGFCPSIRITFPSSLVLMQPSSAPSTKMSKAALNSGERGKRRCGGLAPHLEPVGGQPWGRGFIPGTASPVHTPQNCPGWAPTGQSIFWGAAAEAGWATGWGSRLRLKCQAEDAPTIFLLFCQLLNL